jgi:HSP20 family protein
MRPFFGDLEQSPFASLWQISREMDRLMDAFFGGGFAAGRPRGAPGAESQYARTMWSPQIEVRQRDDALVIHADLPGIKQEDIQLEATEEGIAISGERSEQREEGEQGHRHTERTYGSFYRLIPLPEGARVDGAKASMHNGVLEVTVPLERPQRRRIQIEGGQSRA